MKSIAIAIAFFMAGLNAAGLQAEIYSWTDDNGVKHYSDTPPVDRSSHIKAAQEIQSVPETAPADIKIDEQNVEAVLEALDKENKIEAPQPGAAKQNLSRQQRIQNERKALEEKIAYLENLPPDAFANSRSKNVILGKYQYQLQQLRSNPDGYFDKYGF